MSSCSLFLLFFQVSNKALVIHAFVKEGQGVNAVNGALLPPPPQDGPAGNPDVQVQSYCMWPATSNLSLEHTQKAVSSLHDQL